MRKTTFAAAVFKMIFGTKHSRKDKVNFVEDSL